MNHCQTLWVQFQSLSKSVVATTHTPSKSLESACDTHFFLSFLFSDHEVEVFTKFSLALDSAVKNMHKTAAEQTQRCQNHFKREYQNVGKAFDQLGRALEQDGNYCKFDMKPCIFPKVTLRFSTTD